jgi:hypothetical protein
MTRYKPEQIVTLLRQIEVAIANGKTTSQACKEAQITAQTHYRWRRVRRVKARSGETPEGAGEGKQQAETASGGAVAGEANSERRGRGKLLSPEGRISVHTLARRLRFSRAERSVGLAAGQMPTRDGSLLPPRSDVFVTCGVLGL